AAALLQPLGQARQVDRFAAQEQAPQVLQCRPLPGFVLQRIEGAGGAVDPADVLALNQLADGVGVVFLEVGDDQGGAGDQGAEQVFLGQVEAGGAEQQQVVLRVHAELAGVPVLQVDFA